MKLFAIFFLASSAFAFAQVKEIDILNFFLFLYAKQVLENDSIHIIQDDGETVVSGSGPISKNDPPMKWESTFVSALFTKYCGASTERPTCTCPDGSQWRHPYYIAECSDGSGPVECVCPNGAEFPV